MVQTESSHPLRRVRKETRVLAISSSYPLSETDGTAPFIRAISRGVQAHGLDVVVVVPRHEDFAWSGSDGPVRLRTFRYTPPGAERFAVWGYARGLRSDVGVRPEAVLVAPAALGSATIRLLQMTRRLDPDVLHAHWAIPNGVAAAIVSRLTDTPLVTSLHGSDVYLAERSRVVGWCAGRVFSCADAITSCSRELADRAISLGAASERTTVIPYGVDSDTFRPSANGVDGTARAELGLQPEDRVVLAVGRLVKKKGFRYLIEAVALLRDQGITAHLLFAGTGDEESDLRDLSEAIGVASLTNFLGAVSRDRMPALYRTADALAVPSVRAEGNVDGLPNVLLEGMASGLPVVASRIAGIPDVIRDGENGLLTEPEDAADIADALGRVLEGEGPRKRLAKAARRHVEERLNWRSVTGQYAQVLESVARSP